MKKLKDLFTESPADGKSSPGLTGLQSPAQLSAAGATAKELAGGVKSQALSLAEGVVNGKLTAKEKEEKLKADMEVAELTLEEQKEKEKEKYTKRFQKVWSDQELDIFFDAIITVC